VGKNEVSTLLSPPLENFRRPLLPGTAPKWPVSEINLDAQRLTSHAACLLIRRLLFRFPWLPPRFWLKKSSLLSALAITTLSHRAVDDFQPCHSTPRADRMAFPSVLRWFARAVTYRLRCCCASVLVDFRRGQFTLSFLASSSAGRIVRHYRNTVVLCCRDVCRLGAHLTSCCRFLLRLIVGRLGESVKYVFLRVVFIPVLIKHLPHFDTSCHSIFLLTHPPRTYHLESFWVVCYVNSGVLHDPRPGTPESGGPFKKAGEQTGRKFLFINSIIGNIVSGVSDGGRGANRALGLIFDFSIRLVFGRLFFAFSGGVRF